jgi:putative oxidoreductase
MKMNSFFAPPPNSGTANLALLVLRVWLGIAMLMNHGWDKAMHFNSQKHDFPDLLHIGSPAVNLALVVFAEVVCSALLVVGFITRFAALTLALNLAAAFILVHQMKLTGEHNGELAFIYLAGYVTLLIAGPGRYSTDAAVFGRS